MRKSLVLLSALTLFCACAGERVLPRDAWTPEVHSALVRTIESAPDDSYAVFDFDYTTIVGDISISLMEYMADNLSFAFSEKDAFGAFTYGLPDLDRPLEGVGRSAGDIGTEMAADYAWLRGQKDDTRGTAQCSRIKSDLMALNEGIENTFDYGTWCLWFPGLLKGMSEEQICALTKRSVDHWLADDSMVIPRESVDLINALRKKGVQVYVCSASPETVVEALACDPKYGLNFAEDEVFGIRLDSRGGFDPSYDQTFLEGKVKCIERFMRPAHGGKDPVLVAGDSSGDLPMLTAFPGSVSLVYDKGGRGVMADAIAKGYPNWIVQPRNQYSLRK